MSLNVLVVDDSATTRAVIGKTLRLSEVPLNEIHEAANGQEALDILGRTWIDLVFTDINMPGVDGIQMVERMRQDGLLKTIPVILVSIEGNTHRLEELMSKGVSACVRKPFTPEHIREVVQKVMWPKLGSSHRNEVQEVFQEVWQKYALMFAEPQEPGGEIDPPAACRIGRVSFSGRISGEAVIAVSEATSAEMAASVIGLDTGDAEAMKRADDALQELCNIFCGQTLTRIAGTDAAFDLSTPDVQSGDAAEWTRLAQDPASILFSVEGSPVLVQFGVKERDS